MYRKCYKMLKIVDTVIRVCYYLVATSTFRNVRLNIVRFKNVSRCTVKHRRVQAQRLGPLLYGDDKMKENAIYFAKNDFYNIIKENGGEWNDTKKRPVVCLFQDKNNSGLYWAIPMGAWNHRSDAAKGRIESYINLPESNLASCYYHVGNTTQKSIFFISDAFPITEKYIEREYTGYTSEPYVIKNPNLISELHRKLNRILYFESSTPNYFRQHITDVKNALICDLNNGN